MSMKFLVIVIAAACSSAAQAAISVNADSIGNSYTINYNGFNTPEGIGGTLPGLTATAIFTLTSITGSAFNFSYSISNTSSAPVTTSRVSVFGFDMSPTYDLVQLFTPPGSVFVGIGTASNVPNLSGSDANRICFRAGGGGSQCAGGGGGGVAIGDPAATGSFALASTGVTSLTLDRFFVRYQSISGLGQIGSATGLETVSGAVPEPATWGLMLAGFGIVGSAMRRRQSRLALA